MAALITFATGLLGAITSMFNLVSSSMGHYFELWSEAQSEIFHAGQIVPHFMEPFMGIVFFVAGVAIIIKICPFVG